MRLPALVWAAHIAFDRALGRALSLELAARGCHLALAEVNPVALSETAAAASGRGEDRHRGPPGKLRVRVGKDAVLLDLLERWFPVAIHEPMRRMIGAPARRPLRLRPDALAGGDLSAVITQDRLGDAGQQRRQALARVCP
jgi:hypothetical protein